MIYKEDALWDILDDPSSTIWFIADSEKAKRRPSISRKLLQRYSKKIYAVNIDRMINVYKISQSG
jgi:hypothetical protein